MINLDKSILHTLQLSLNYGGVGVKINGNVAQLIKMNYCCPYCGQTSYTNQRATKGKVGPYTDWFAVRGHAGYCSLKNNEYVIDKDIGPIHYSELIGLDQYSFKEKFPTVTTKLSNLSRSLKHRNIDTGSHLKRPSKEDLLSSIKTFYSKHNRIPSYDELLIKNNLFSEGTYIRQFGSWKQAIIEAGYEPNTVFSFGIKTVAKDGILYRSKAEAYFVDNYLYNQYDYIYESKYTDGSTKLYDFYIPSLDLYIELTGGINPQNIQEKIAINKQQNKKLLVINTKDIYKKEKLTEFL